MTELKKPANSFHLKINDEERDIKMSFALLQEIMKVIPSPENIASLLIQDFYLREYVVRRVLTGNKRVVSDDDLIDLFDLEFEDEALDDLVLWVTDHILYFFTNTVEKSLNLGVRYKEKMAGLIPSNPSPTGSPN